MDIIFLLIVVFLTIVLLILADSVALFLYPLWAWRNPDIASASYSLAKILDWKWLIDVVNPEKNQMDSVLVRFFQCILRQLDAFVPVFWNTLFMNFSPMKKRKYYIDYLDDDIRYLPIKTQKKYYAASDANRRVYLIRSNKLSQEVMEFLYHDNYINDFIEAGKITDAQFMTLSAAHLQSYCEKNDLSLGKQQILVSRAFSHNLLCCPSLRSYIMRKGLHPSAVKLFYDKLDDYANPNDPELKQISDTLKFRQDLVTVQQTMPENYDTPSNVQAKLQKFELYLQERKKLGYSAQVAMCTEQYKVFHKNGFKMRMEAVHAKLALVNKNNEAVRFVELMMQYGELRDDQTAMQQVAGDDKLTALWLNHLAGVKKSTE